MTKATKLQRDLKESIRRRYVVLKGSSPDLINAYWEHCRRVNWPYVQINQRIKYGYLTPVDMPGISVLDQWGNQEMQKVVRDNGIDTRKIPVEFIDWFARKVFDIHAASYARSPRPPHV